MKTPRLPTDNQLWHSMSETMRSVILPTVADPWARAALIRLIGLAEYAPARGADPSDERCEELIRCIDALASGHEEIKSHLPRGWPDVEAGDVMTLCSALLVASVTSQSPDALAVRAQLRPILKAHLAEDFARTSPLIPFFAGRIDD